jgi:D-serine deaminase-like pyridoxal phosphate-dependent protein
MRPRWNLSPQLIAQTAADIRQVLPPHVRWAPEISSDFSQPCIDALQSEMFACRSVYVSDQLLQSGSFSQPVPATESQALATMIVRYPIVRPDDVDVLVRVASRFSLQIVVDHFRHAELVSEAAAMASATIGLLIDVDLGYQRTGVRPGPDSVLLAQGIMRLPGLKLGGVFLRTSVLPESPSLTSDLQNSITVGRHCQKFIQSADIDCPNLVVEDSRGLPFGQDALMILDSPLPVSPGQIQEPMSSENAEQAARVIARPSLEWCVIDAGTNDLRTIEVPNVLKPSGATVRTMDREQTTLSLADESLDLRIGDIVTLSCGR